MATLTERKRIKHTLRYARKDARTAIYRTLYGRCGEIDGRGANDPMQDETRRLSADWSYQQAERTWKEFIELAQFTPQAKALHERRLDQLKHHKPKA